jgi:uncharacterized Ntn-hydrolase superfamily protein
MTGSQPPAITVELVGGDAATWAVKVDGDTIAACGNATLARQTADRVAKRLEREALVASIRALASYLEQHENVPCNHVNAITWFHDANELAECAARMPGSVLDNTGDYSVDIRVDFGSQVTLEAKGSRSVLCPTPPVVRELPPELARLSQVA